MNSHPRVLGTLVVVLALLAASLSVSVAIGQAATRSAVRHDFRPQPRDVRNFWTRARMRSAPPITAALVPWRSASDGWTSPARSRLVRKSALAASASSEEAPFERREVSDPSAYPYRLHGKLFVKVGRAMYHCSATALNSANESVVFTAAHCLYGEDLGGWVTSVMFVPGYLSGDHPYGEWVAASAFVTPGWIAEETGRVDIGALVMEPLNGSSLQDAIGGRDFAAQQDREQHFEAFGYPAAEPFDGERLYVCEADTYWIDSSVPGSGPDPMGIGCDMTQGSSGGGWVIDGKSLNSVNSYGYVNRSGDDLPYMFGPYFGAAASNLFDKASAVPVDVPAPQPTESSSPAPTPSVSPSASPTGPAPRTSSRKDADDSRSLFDISNVAVTEEDGTVTVVVQTHDEWSARLLSNAHPRNIFFVDFDTLAGARPDFYLAVYSSGGELFGDVLRYASGGAYDVGSATVIRPTRDGFTATMSGDDMQMESKLRWIASSHFKSRKRCPRVCSDFSPNRGLASL